MANKTPITVFTLSPENAIEVSEAMGALVTTDTFLSRSYLGKVMGESDDIYERATSWNIIPSMLHISVNEKQGLCIEHCNGEDAPARTIPFGSEIALEDKNKNIFLHVPSGSTESKIFTTIVYRHQGISS